MTGRDRAVLFSAEMAQEVEHRRSIELDLRDALETETLRLHYQPVISCRTGDISRRGSAAALAPSCARRDVAGRLHSRSPKVRASFPRSANGFSIAQ